MGGILLYYYPWAGPFSAAGLAFMLLSSVGYALNMTLNRRLLTSRNLDARELVAKPMLFGAAVLLAAGIAVEGIPPVTWRLILILCYLSGLSGALGFYLWTRSQASLTAFESSGINNLMLVEIALMDFFVFHRSFSAAADRRGPRDLRRRSCRSRKKEQRGKSQTDKHITLPRPFDFPLSSGGLSEIHFFEKCSTQIQSIRFYRLRSICYDRCKK